MSFSLRARYVLPVDGPAIEHGVVTCAGERIVQIVARADGECVDLGDCVLLPGLVNAHTHLEFSRLRTPLGTAGMPLPDWIRLVIADRGRGRELSEQSPGDGIQESLRAGV